LLQLGPKIDGKNPFVINTLSTAHSAQIGLALKRGQQTEHG